MDVQYYVYILRCADDTLYTGIATDPVRRLAEHVSGRGAKYTRGRGPLSLVYCEPVGSRAAAQKREFALKRLSHGEKEALIAACRAVPE